MSLGLDLMRSCRWDDRSLNFHWKQPRKVAIVSNVQKHDTSEPLQEITIMTKRIRKRRNLKCRTSNETTTGASAIRGSLACRKFPNIYPGICGTAETSACVYGSSGLLSTCS